jgi:hypothetical protein
MGRVIPDFAEMYGIEATPELVRELRAAQPSGIHLQRRNIEDPSQVRDLIASLRREIGPLEFAVRHEGGAETPFVRGVTSFPGLEALEEAGNPALARDVGRAMGHELAAMGITMNLVSETGPMSVELAVGMRCVGIKVGVGPVIPGATREPDEVEAAALAASVAEAAIHVDRDPGRLMPLATGRRVGLLVPRLGDVADRIAVEDGLRMTAARLRPNVGASVAVMEVALQPDEKSVAFAADWLAAQEVGVFFCFDAHRFEGQRRLLEAVGSRCARLIVGTIGNSRDEELVADHAAVIRTCGFQECQLRAALRTIFEQKQK